MRRSHIRRIRGFLFFQSEPFFLFSKIQDSFAAAADMPSSSECHQVASHHHVAVMIVYAKHDLLHKPWSVDLCSGSRLLRASQGERFTFHPQGFFQCFLLCVKAFCQGVLSFLLTLFAYLVAVGGDVAVPSGFMHIPTRNKGTAPAKCLNAFLLSHLTEKAPRQNMF